jgi:hypothetical protein
MTTTHQDEQGKKPRQRNSKADRRAQKAAQQQSPKPDQPEQHQIEPSIASSDAPAIASSDAPAGGAIALEDVPMMMDEVAPAPAPAIVAAAPTDPDPISIQTIANAYRDYTRKSFQESGSLVENLMGARSFDKAIEVQTEFARRAYANFVAESQKMGELYRELAKQAFRPWSGFAAKATRADR